MEAFYICSRCNRMGSGEVCTLKARWFGPKCNGTMRKAFYADALEKEIGSVIEEWQPNDSVHAYNQRNKATTIFDQIKKLYGKVKGDA